jgi:hypothetical protein
MARDVPGNGVLYDQIERTGVFNFSGGQCVAKTSDEDVVYTIQNVFDYYRKHYWGQIKKDGRLFPFDKQFPNCAPPHKRMWMEWTTTQSELDFNGATGCFITVQEADDVVMPSSANEKDHEDAQRAIAEIKRYHEKAWMRAVDAGSIDPDTQAWSDTVGFCVEAIYGIDGRSSSYIEALWAAQTAAFEMSNWTPYKLRWLLSVQPIVPIRGRPVYTGITYLVPVAPDGRVFKSVAIGDRESFAMVTNVDVDGWRDIMQAIREEDLYPCLLALSFLNCKNIRVERTAPAEQIRQQRRSGVKPGCTFHTLNITPMRKTVVAPGAVREPSGRHMPLHIMRGHFKTYDAKPLWGKHRGTFWWDDQVRGDPDVGVADKNYNVKEPAHGKAQRD